MKKALIVVCLLAVGMALHAQTKTDQIKHIRQVYAQAKQKVAKMGQDGKAAHTVHIRQIEMGAPGDEYTPEEDTDIEFYFDRIGGDSEQGITGKAVCYFMSVNWMADGHTNYREYLFDPVNGHLLFAFMKAETHAGFKVETRYYYDAKGNCIEQKHKVQDKEATPESHSWNDWKSELAQGNKHKGLFDLLLNTELPYPELGSAHYPSSTPKAKLLKDIRAAYAKAKQKIAENDKDGGLKNDIEITIHDQKSEDFPPVTTLLKCYYEHIQKPSPYQRYYFISEKTESMYGETYEEYLLDPKPDTQSVVFIYNQGYAEGEEMEMRYYYDENGHCFESKVSDIVESEPVPARNKAGYIFSIFDEFMQ